MNVHILKKPLQYGFCLQKLFEAVPLCSAWAEKEVKNLGGAGLDSV